MAPPPTGERRSSASVAGRRSGIVTSVPRRTAPREGQRAGPAGPIEPRRYRIDGGQKMPLRHFSCAPGDCGSAERARSKAMPRRRTTSSSRNLLTHPDRRHPAAAPPPRWRAPTRARPASRGQHSLLALGIDEGLLETLRRNEQLSEIDEILELAPPEQRADLVPPRSRGGCRHGRPRSGPSMALPAGADR